MASPRDIGIHTGILSRDLRIIASRWQLKSFVYEAMVIANSCNEDTTVHRLTGGIFPRTALWEINYWGSFDVRATLAISAPALFSRNENLLPSNSGFAERLFHQGTRKPMLIRSNPSGIVSGHRAREDARKTFYGFPQWQLSFMGIKGWEWLRLALGLLRKFPAASNGGKTPRK